MCLSVYVCVGHTGEWVQSQNGWTDQDTVGDRLTWARTPSGDCDGSLCTCGGGGNAACRYHYRSSLLQHCALTIASAAGRSRSCLLSARLSVVTMETTTLSSSSRCTRLTTIVSRNAIRKLFAVDDRLAAADILQSTTIASSRLTFFTGLWRRKLSFGSCKASKGHLWHLRPCKFGVKFWIWQRRSIFVAIFHCGTHSGQYSHTCNYFQFFKSSTNPQTSNARRRQMLEAENEVLVSIIEARGQALTITGRYWSHVIIAY